MKRLEDILTQENIKYNKDVIANLLVNMQIGVEFK